MNKVKFLGYDCEVHFHEYGNGRKAIQLVDSADGEPVTTASVNLPDSPIPKGYTAIKNYSENEGLLEILVEAGIVSPAQSYVRSGFVSIPVCEILI